MEAVRSKIRRKKTGKSKPIYKIPRKVRTNRKWPGIKGKYTKHGPRNRIGNVTIVYIHKNDSSYS